MKIPASPNSLKGALKRDYGHIVTDFRLDIESFPFLSSGGSCFLFRYNCIRAMTETRPHSV